MNLLSSPLLTDLYELTMLNAYLAHGMRATAVFELYMRKLPPGRNFMLAVGLEQALAYVENLRFLQEELEWVEKHPLFGRSFARYLEGLHFTGDVHAMPEGTVFFADEPLLRITAPLPEAQLLESRLMNVVHYQTLVATKAARAVLAAPGKVLVDFGMRRAHGAEAALLAARASYIAGYAGTATVIAGAEFGIPLYGTMAHSFVQAHETEAAAFRHFLEVYPQGTTLLIDTYDTERGACEVVKLAAELRERGFRVKAVRLDSGDLALLACKVRATLDQAGLTDIAIFASGNLDEHRLHDFVTHGAPIDGYGVGSSLSTSSDAPALDAVYKLQEYAGQPRRKRSTGKATWPGRKQVYRYYDASGRFERDVLTLEHDRNQGGEALLAKVMENGKRVAGAEALESIRERAASQLARLPDTLRGLEIAHERYTVEVSPALHKLTNEMDAQLQPELNVPV